ncbi:C1QL [Mytilus coruscus]|uniref:C1QL n=1 Tax=Mytilus coruscus TaxID=42192 RepID=A0A6J8ATL4_MYTCO|nr:C1QL [Mytilus coruscus]
MHTMLESLSSKIKDVNAAEKNRENALESIQYTLHQEQKRFNQSFNRFLENTKLVSNKTIHELIARQQKETGRCTILCLQNTQPDTSYSHNYKFDNVLTNIGKEYDPSTGIFTATHQGVYHFSVISLSVHDKSCYLRLFHNNELTLGNLVTGDGYKTGTMNVVLNLQKGDTVSVRGNGGHTVYSDSTYHVTYSGYLIG